MNLKDETQRERSRMLSGGMIEVSKAKINEMLTEIGYKIKGVNCFDYINTGNDITYRAKSIDLVLEISGISFSNINANRDNLPALQNIRRNYFAFENGRIWEL